jgi:hypothetical protein
MAKNVNNNNNNNNEVANMVNTNNNDAMNKQMMQQFKQMMRSPIMKKAMLQAEKMMAESKQKLDFEKGLAKVHQDNIQRFVGGNPSDRDKKVLRVIDGNLVRVTTDSRSICKSIEAIKSFEELDTMERSYLYENNKPLYKKLQMDAYTPNVDGRLIDLLSLEGECMLEYFDIEASCPSKPSLQGVPLVGGTASELMANYTKAKADYETAKANYMKDIEAYQDGVMHSNLRDCQDRIDTLEKELKGEA